MERVTRIELALSAWEADVLPLNYTRGVQPGELRVLRKPLRSDDCRDDIVPEPVSCLRAALRQGHPSPDRLGRVKIDPFAPELVQPSSVDVRLDRYFRVFENHKYPHIDPAIEQADLTRLVETDGKDPFVLHPGEFVLGIHLRGGHAP